MNDTTATVDLDDPRLVKVRKLLAKAESTTFTEEADAYMAKVAQLVAELGIDEALLWATTDTEVRATPTKTVIVCEAPYAARKSYLVAAIADTCGCRTVRTTAKGNEPIQVNVFGFASDIAAVEMLSTSLLIQMTTAMLTTEAPHGSTSATTAWRRSFITAFADRVAARLNAARKQHTESHDAAAGNPSTSTALVLADRDEAVVAEMRREFPRLRKVQMRAGSSAAGRAAGRDAADRADIGGSRLDGPRASLPSVS